MKITFKNFLVLAILVLIAPFLSHYALKFAGIDLLLAAVVLVMIVEGIVTIELRWKWIGFIYHALCATIFYVLYSSEHFMFDGWEWYLLWSVLAFRLLILQPVYLINIKKRVVKNAP